MLKLLKTLKFARCVGGAQGRVVGKCPGGGRRALAGQQPRRDALSGGGGREDADAHRDCPSMVALRGGGAYANFPRFSFVFA